MKELFENTPIARGRSYRKAAQEAAETARKKREGKILVQVDDKTWVYCMPGETPRHPDRDLSWLKK